MAKTVYVSIGNSDDKLSQAEWSRFFTEVDLRLEGFATHGRWLSAPNALFQNACWCVVIPEHSVEGLKRWLRRTAKKYRQDSIAWAEAVTTFLIPEGNNHAE